MNYFQVNNLTIESINSDKEILFYLENLNTSFIPMLSDKVNLEKYSKKIASKAFVRVIKHKDEFAGLYALYIDEITKEGYLTCIGVLEKFKGLGISSFLIDDVMVSATKGGMNKIKLEVDSINHRAIKFYQKKGFHRLENIDNHTVSFYMMKTL